MIPRTMSGPEKITEQESHRRQAAGFFNETWTLLDKTSRTTDEDLRMIHLAHASRWHWELAGTAENLVTGEWQIARVYCVLRRAEPALFHARRCLQLVERHGLAGFQRGCAHEAMARAWCLAGGKAEAADHLKKAQEIGSQLNDAEDRKVLFDDLATIPL
ncbi:MAG: hypothetical protein HY301_15905 [Verrucomicrobia bacterium]|nr:hypothetical protein [Verrucomicrobiota bacterium]